MLGGGYRLPAAGFPVIPHFHHIWPGISQALQLAETLGEVHTACAEGDALEFAREVLCYRNRVLEVNR